jgi:hypothetical protein
MVQGQNTSYVQNSFVGGFKTEFTGLNFPENSCTSVENFIFTITGDATRRGGFDFEANYNGITGTLGFSGQAFVLYKWNNVGGDGLTEMVVNQVGQYLYFYKSSAATSANPLSTQVVNGQTPNIASFVSAGNTFDNTLECQFADGNGVLFVYHPQCDPFYVVYNSATNTFSETVITVQTRDFVGIPEPGVADNYRPPTGGLTPAHLYNLYNQGWTTASWAGTTVQALNIGIGSIAITLNTQTNTTTALVGQIVNLGGNCTNGSQTGGFGMSGTVTAYATPVITINITSFSTGLPGFTSFGTVNLVLASQGNINTFEAALGNAPSNSDVWWRFLNAAGTFAPATTAANVPLDNAPAPKGHFILNEFNQQKSAISGVAGMTPLVSTSRPGTGAFFSDRVWYAGVKYSQVATGNAPYNTWTESIYFSQSVTQQIQGAGTAQYGQCYQTNDPTSNVEFDLLPTDGGVIVIEGSGTVYKLFPVTNGILAFAANGIWFITGGTGLGFQANDYSVNKISNVRSISGSSFVNVLGYPVFWNEEGIWTVTPNQQAVPYGHGGLVTENLCLGTILTYFNSIPTISKSYAKGDFDPINFTIQWVFRSSIESGISNRYIYDSALALNTINHAFYPYSFSNSESNINIAGIIYVQAPGTSTTLTPVFKYPTIFPRLSDGVSLFTFSEERDTTNWVDFISWNGVGFNYNSFFVAGYNLHGGTIARWNPEYIYLFLRGSTNSYLINGIWDYAIDPSSGRIPSAEYVQVVTPLLGMQIKRHRVRGRGYAFQLQIQSVQGQPLDLMGWSIYEHKAAGP